MDSNLKTTVQSKFCVDEIVLSVVPLYQNSSEPNHIIAIVYSTGGHGLFILNTSKYPPHNLSDLSVSKVYPINDQLNLQLIDQTLTVMDSNLYRVHHQDIQLAKTLTEEYEIIQGEETGNSDFGWMNKYLQFDSKTKKIQELVEKRRHEYIELKNLTIYIATWNVNIQLPNEKTLEPWLAATNDPPDIYAVAFQELDMSPKAIALSESRVDQAWLDLVMKGLHKSATYKKLTAVRLVGMMLIVAVKEKFQNLEVTEASVGSGALNRLGNKGGIGISLKINEEMICFVNSHLAAHVQEIEQRRKDYEEINNRMEFWWDNKKKFIGEHDHIFWFGDLNYRINTDSAWKNYLDEENYVELFKRDQLFIEMENKRVFKNYHEEVITFKPTYKYDPGTDNWDSSEKCRSAAWCDRILWKSKKDKRIKQSVYNSINELRLSDHKPVYGIFDCKIETKNLAKYKKVQEETLKRMDKYENDNRPQISVDETEILFDEIRFNQSQIRQLTVVNNGHLSASFQFKKKESSNTICENWILISENDKQEKKLNTGDKLLITIEILVNSKNVAAFMEKNIQLKKTNSNPLDILVLDVECGSDIFISIFGEYKPSSFGLSLDTLMMLTEPIAQMDLSELWAIELKNREFKENLSTIQKLPPQLFFLIDYLFKNGLKEPKLFTLDRIYAKNKNINEIIEWLDTKSTDEYPGTVQTTAEALLMLLESTSRSFLEVLGPFTACVKHEDFLVKINKLPRHWKRIFLYICSFLKEVKKNYLSNRIDDNVIGNLFGKALLNPRKAKTSVDKLVQFMINFLEYDFKYLMENELQTLSKEKANN